MVIFENLVYILLVDLSIILSIIFTLSMLYFSLKIDLQKKSLSLYSRA